mmetsp:Transcript_95247/g.238742  ORF Transcript_95247/g.238742 Transcript_95247/m.238742 type:complete len:226 (+) Transcript_95247:345-1022(+)
MIRGTEAVDDELLPETTSHWGVSSYMHWKTSQFKSKWKGTVSPFAAFVRRYSCKRTWSLSDSSKMLPSWVSWIKPCNNPTIVSAVATKPPELGYLQGVLPSGNNASICPTKKWLGPHTRSAPPSTASEGSQEIFCNNSSALPKMTVSHASINMTMSSERILLPTKPFNVRTYAMNFVAKPSQGKPTPTGWKVKPLRSALRHRMAVSCLYSVAQARTCTRGEADDE